MEYQRAVKHFCIFDLYHSPLVVNTPFCVSSLTWNLSAFKVLLKSHGPQCYDTNEEIKLLGIYGTPSVRRKVNKSKCEFGGLQYWLDTLSLVINVIRIVPVSFNSLLSFVCDCKFNAD